MFVLKFLRRHWGKLLLLFVFLYFFEVVDELEESLGFNSGRMEALQKNGRLAPFPKERAGLNVWHSTGMFHDVYYIYFRAKPETVSRWMDDSPGIVGANAELRSDGSNRYSLGPGKGFVYISANRTEVGMVCGFTIDSPAGDSPIKYQHEPYKRE